ncbi:LuxR C-terminal-related transcriptional regulator [Paenibacillus thalictri]|uniref:LuxR family transcriptional regulator n=1 Tax=Paenibacillus thalictri TaxID=2527873 RepID=A0A4Q9DLI9_9BACL|nr:LuxR C-terminal-related transcriptional regulator [Paenibacillus thalictri]TBL75972.1 LuxR family transcriptional regulator [Paenibacillus thalictri]
MIRQADPIILKTKIVIPALKESTVMRDRLVDSIHSGLKGRLTIVCAPTGFGKTTLLAQWAHTRQHLCAWVSLDERDNDTVRFWRYIAHALAAVIPDAIGDRILQLSQVLPSLSSITFLDALINELFVLPEPVTLILDDYHNIFQKQIHDSFSYLVHHLPETMHLLVATRTELPFSTVQWMAKKEQNQIDTLQLQFTPAEMELFCRSMAGMTLSERYIEQLMLCTEGWVTGLQLMALSLRSEPDYSRFMEECRGNHPRISEYLFHEVVSKLPADIYRFLMKTSVLSRMDPLICDAVTQESGSLRMLTTVRSMNLFLVPLDDQNSWFRYHHLFSQFLQELLKRTDPQQWITSNRLASEAFAERGYLDEAVDHAIASRDFALMETYLARHIPVVLKRGEFATLLRWFESIPSDFTPSPELALLYAFVLTVTGQPERSEHELQLIERECQAMGHSERSRQLQSGIVFVRSNLVFLTGDFDHWLAFMDGILDDNLPENPTYYNFNYNLAEPLVRRTALGLKGLLSTDTETIGIRFTEILEAHGWRHSLIHLYVKQSLCEGYYEWNRMDQCRELLLEMEKTVVNGQIPGLFIPIRIIKARIYITEGRLHLAHAIIEETLETAVKLPDTRWMHALRSCKAGIYVREGRITEAKQELTRLGISAKDKPTFNREFEYLALVRLLGKQRKEAEAIRLLELLKLQSEREQLLSSLVEISNLQALLEYQLGKRSSALKLLHEALLIGERNGYIRSFLDEGTAMAELLTSYLNYKNNQAAASERTGVSEEYVRKLLGLFPIIPKAYTHLTSDLSKSLSRNELNLLQLIRQGATNKQIAAALHLSEGTVKVYLSRLYEKLGVSSRTQALNIVQESHLLNNEGD